MTERPAIILTLPPPISANRMFLFERTRRGMRRLAPDYIAWRDNAGWIVKMQFIGQARVDCRFDIAIAVPVSRKDVDNQIKSTIDLLQNCGVIGNDANAVSVSIRAEARADCVVTITPRPDLPGARAAARLYVRKAAAPKARTSRQMLAFGRRMAALGPP